MLAPPFWATTWSQSLLDVRGVHHDHHLVLEPVDGAVVHEGALGREQRRVLHVARRERADVVAADPVDEGVPVGAGDLEFPHVRHVEEPRAGARGLVLGQDAGGVLHRHFPAGERHDLGAEGHVDVVERGALESVVASHELPYPIKRRHQGLLHVQAVLRLVPHPRLRSLEHRLRHFLPAVGREAVEEDRLRVGAPHQRLVHHVALEGAGPELRLALLPHRRPDVGGDHVRPRDRLVGVLGHQHLGEPGVPLEDVAVGLVPLGAGQPQLEAEECRRR